MSGSPYSGAAIVDESPLLVQVRMPDGREFWIPREKFVASPKPAQKPRVVGHRDLATGKVVRVSR